MKLIKRHWKKLAFIVGMTIHCVLLWFAPTTVLYVALCSLYATTIYATVAVIVKEEKKPKTLTNEQIQEKIESMVRNGGNPYVSLELMLLARDISGEQYEYFKMDYIDYFVEAKKRELDNCNKEYEELHKEYEELRSTQIITQLAGLEQ